MSNITNMPIAKQVEFGGLTLQLRLDGRSVLAIEKRLDKSLMGLFISGQGGFRLPPTNELLIVLQGANKSHGVKDKDIIAAFENFIDEGHTTMELQEIIQELLDESGFMGKSETENELTSGESEEMTLESNPMDNVEL